MFPALKQFAKIAFRNAVGLRHSFACQRGVAQPFLDIMEDSPDRQFAAFR